MKKKLNPKDQKMLEAFEAGEFESDLKDGRRTQLAQLAKATIKYAALLNQYGLGIFVENGRNCLTLHRVLTQRQCGDHRRYWHGH